MGNQNGSKHFFIPLNVFVEGITLITTKNEKGGVKSVCTKEQQGAKGAKDKQAMVMCVCSCVCQCCSSLMTSNHSMAP